MITFRVISTRPLSCSVSYKVQIMKCAGPRTTSDTFNTLKCAPANKDTCILECETSCVKCPRMAPWRLLVQAKSSSTSKLGCYLDRTHQSSLPFHSLSAFKSTWPSGAHFGESLWDREKRRQMCSIGTVEPVRHSGGYPLIAWYVFGNRILL